ncbi:MAG: SRPBCC family protein [Acidobacteria bacterium]|uniref:SRPBCC family protein n=1 Tax=Candidatus Polarisedimenticola svalbardensis TaxID=2886004 RepID=A0A8J6Y2J2_9BACT|nr:SRPBCC family protein [Candidatus Polarisedimenticola svalbardensis]
MKITRLTSNTQRLETAQFINLPRPDVFAFFSDPRNLEAITPPWLSFRITGQSDKEIGQGTELTYRLRVHGLPMKWVSRITEWEPDRQFVDVQQKGPYAYWHHRHIFEEVQGGTMIRDQVDFQIPFGRLGRRLAGKMIEADIREIFRYRSDLTERLLSIPKKSEFPGAAWIPLRAPVTWH